VRVCLCRPLRLLSTSALQAFGRGWGVQCSFGATIWGQAIAVVQEAWLRRLQPLMPRQQLPRQALGQHSLHHYKCRKYCNAASKAGAACCCRCIYQPAIHQADSVHAGRPNQGDSSRPGQAGQVLGGCRVVTNLPVLRLPLNRRVPACPTSRAGREEAVCVRSLLSCRAVAAVKPAMLGWVPAVPAAQRRAGQDSNVT